MLQQEILEELLAAYPAPTKLWASTFCYVPASIFESIFARISPQLISQDAKLFALGMLSANQQMIRKVTGV
jgi:hypothetical protein